MIPEQTQAKMQCNQEQTTGLAKLCAQVCTSDDKTERKEPACAATHNWMNAEQAAKGCVTGCTPGQTAMDQ